MLIFVLVAEVSGANTVLRCKFAGWRSANFLHLQRPKSPTDGISNVVPHEASRSRLIVYGSYVCEDSEECTQLVAAACSRAGFQQKRYVLLNCSFQTFTDKLL